MPVITVSDRIQLVRNDNTDSDLIRYDEVEFSWETGNFVEVSPNASPADILDKYLQTV
jgi:hypothetical protein